MDQSNHPLQEVSRLRLLAAALELQHLTSTAANVVPIPGTERFVVIGTRGEVARLLGGPAAEQPSGALPPLPLDLDNSPARMSIQIKAGELAELIRRWGREVYASAQAAPEAPASEQRSDLTTVPCPVCAEDRNLMCDECDGQGQIIVSRADLAGATTASASARVELVELLKAIRPSYGAAGSRDVDVAAQQRRIDRAIELLSASIDGEKGGAV